MITSVKATWHDVGVIARLHDCASDCRFGRLAGSHRQVAAINRSRKPAPKPTACALKERGVTPPRIDAATRLSLAWLSRLCDWRSCVIVVRPETIVRWHRAGWRLFWRYKSRPGRPPIPLELRQLIRRMASDNPLWGEERIANELLVKLGIRLSPRTVRK